MIFEFVKQKSVRLNRSSIVFGWILQNVFQ
jgi:hypothetical protein